MSTEIMDKDVGVIIALDKIDWEADSIAKAVENNDYDAYLVAVRESNFEPISLNEFATLVNENQKNKTLYAKDLVKSVLTTLTSEEIARTKLKLNDLLAYEGMKGMKALIDQLKIEGYDTGLLQLMLDPKWDDIGNTVENYITRLHRSGLGEHAAYLTLMANGGKEMMQKAVAMRNKLGLKTKLLAVTALTTLDEQQTQRIYGSNRDHSVLKMAQDALDAGMDGIVCSGQEATILRGVFGDDFLIVTPGIRSEAGNVENDDQKNVNTPIGARINGVDEEVIGRDILANKKITNPVEALRNVLNATKGIEKGKIDSKLHEFEKILYTGSWEDLLKYIGAFYIRPENGAYVRLASGLLSNGYVNIGVAERNPYVLEKASYGLQTMLSEKKIKADVVMGAQMGSVRLSSHLAKAMGVEESIYTEKENDESIEVFAERMANKSTHDYQSGISSIQDRQTFIKSIVDEYNKLDGMALKRHNIDLKGKSVVISEDVITKATTTRKMIEIIQNAGGTVVAITCLANRTGEDNVDGIPLFTAYTPAPFELYHDDKTPPEAVKNNPKIPDGATKVEKPKVAWNELVQSMRSN